MIDEKGRLFGKINLIDLLVVLILAAGAVFLALRLLSPGERQTPVLVRVSMYCEETPDYVAESISIGDTVFNSTDSVYLGAVESFELFDSATYVDTPEGDTILTSKEGYRSVSLSSTVEGILDDNGLSINGKRLGVGHTMVIYAGYAKLYLKISAIEAVS